MDLEPDDSTKSDISRYALWLLLAYTANANRRHYRMSTTWLPHFVTNTFSLLLPDAVRALFPRQHAPRNIIEEIALRMIRNNPAYAMYVAPLALGYILSHPDFNIYKGDWAELELAGFHLDSLPHSATAFALALLVCDTLHVTQNNAYTGWWTRLLRWGYANRVGVSFGVVALITAFWEYSEYRIHHYEMRERGDVTKINMQWSAEDTRKDVASNFIGWALAMLWQRRRR